MDKPTEWLGIVFKRHNEWIKIVNAFGEFNYAEDIVQELYLVLYKYADEEKIIFIQSIIYRAFLSWLSLIGFLIIGGIFI